MKYNCTHCGLTSPDGNLWCQRKECSANHITEIMQRGDRLGDIRITNLLRVTRTASIYEAERDEQKILLKVAHHDTEEDREHHVGFARYLKEEAKIFAEIAAKTNNTRNCQSYCRHLSKPRSINVPMARSCSGTSCGLIPFLNTSKANFYAICST